VLLLLLLLLLTVTANTGSGGMSEGGQEGVLPPVRNSEEEEVEEEEDEDVAREDMSADVAAEQGVQWRWVMGWEGVSQGRRGVGAEEVSVMGWCRAAALGWSVRMPVRGDSSDGQIEDRRGTQLMGRE
jgi:hypothetical protein